MQQWVVSKDWSQGCHYVKAWIKGGKLVAEGAARPFLERFAVDGDHDVLMEGDAHLKGAADALNL